MHTPKIFDGSPVESVLHMNSGDGPNSYAANSTRQRNVLMVTRAILEESVRNTYNKTLSDHFTMADLGCASGPNSLEAAATVIQVIAGLCGRTGKSTPEILVFLNDLPRNDFNSVSMALPAFYERLQKNNEGMIIGSNKCFVSAMPGSFYGRLFPRNSLHFVHSSFSIQWLSQAMKACPKENINNFKELLKEENFYLITEAYASRRYIAVGIDSPYHDECAKNKTTYRDIPNGLEDSKGSIYVDSNCSVSVWEAYLKQFQRDFTLFLSCRAQEILPHGQMVLTLPGKATSDPRDKATCFIWELLSECLLEMAAEGLVEEVDIHSFNLPFYIPCIDEVRDIVEKEGSFTIDKLSLQSCSTSPLIDEDSKLRCARTSALRIRALVEQMLVSHFGRSLAMDDLFQRHEKKGAKYVTMHMETSYSPFILVSLTKK